MPLILNRGRLLTRSGQLATATTCCCTDRPPPTCWDCPPICYYVVSVRNPVFLESQRTNPCDFLAFSDLSYRSKLFRPGDLSPPVPAGFGDAESETFAAVGLSAGLFQWSVRSTYSEIELDPPDDRPFGFTASYRAQAFLVCTLNDELEPPAYEYQLSIVFRISAVVAGTGPSDEATSPLDPEARYGFLKFREYYKNTTLSEVQCEEGIAGCFIPDSVFLWRFLKSQEFTMSPSGTSLGSWDSTYDEISGPPPGFPPSEFQSDVEDAFDHLVDTASATFGVLKRDSCEAVGCNCALNISGLKVRFEGQDFVLGTPANFIEDGYVYEHSASGGEYRFEKYKFDSDGFAVVVEYTYLTMQCGLNAEADPQVNLWFLTVETGCSPFDINIFPTPAGFAQREFVAHIKCYKGTSADQCPGTSFAGQFIPLGEPEEIEEIEDSPFLQEGIDDCGAPGFPEFSIDQDCTS